MAVKLDAEHCAAVTGDAVHATALGNHFMSLIVSAAHQRDVAALLAHLSPTSHNECMPRRYEDVPVNFSEMKTDVDTYPFGQCPRCVLPPFHAA